jgi:hypothetical protein
VWLAKQTSRFGRRRKPTKTNTYKNMSTNTINHQAPQSPIKPRNYWVLLKNEEREYADYHEVVVKAKSSVEAKEMATQLPEACDFPIPVHAVHAGNVRKSIANAEKYQARSNKADMRAFVCIVQDVSDDTFTSVFVTAPSIREAYRNAIDERKDEHGQSHIANDCGYVVAMVFDLSDFQNMHKLLTADLPDESQAIEPDANPV